MPFLTSISVSSPVLYWAGPAIHRVSQVEYGDEPANALKEVGGLSNNINEGFVGEYVHFVGYRCVVPPLICRVGRSGWSRTGRNPMSGTRRLGLVLSLLNPTAVARTPPNSRLFRGLEESVMKGV